MQETLESFPHNLPTLVLSIDDLYLPHDKQEELAKAHPNNPLVQHRGQPSTHDLDLGRKVFQDLAFRKENVKIPSYDKSAFNGAGDQKPEEEWQTVNKDASSTIEVIIFEGWCVGFRALSNEQVAAKWRDANSDWEKNGDDYKGQLGRQNLSSASFVNNSLKEYDTFTDRFDAFVHM